MKAVQRTPVLQRVQLELADAAVAAQICSNRLAHIGKQNTSRRISAAAQALARVVYDIGGITRCEALRDFDAEFSAQGFNRNLEQQDIT